MLGSPGRIAEGERFTVRAFQGLLGTWGEGNVWRRLRTGGPIAPGCLGGHGGGSVTVLAVRWAQWRRNDRSILTRTRVPNGMRRPGGRA